MSVVFFVLGMAGATTRRGAGIHALSNVHRRRTPAQSGSSRQVAAGYRMTAAVGGNPCKRLQATLAPCGQPPRFPGAALVDTFAQRGGGKDKKPLPGWITSAEKGF